MPLGWVAEWLCSGLQSRVRRFDSDPSLHLFKHLRRFLRCCVPSCYRFATTKHNRCELLRRLIVRVLHDMRVNVHGDADSGMPHERLDALGVYVLRAAQRER